MPSSSKNRGKAGGIRRSTASANLDDDAVRPSKKKRMEGTCHCSLCGKNSEDPYLAGVGYGLLNVQTPDMAKKRDSDRGQGK